MAKPYVDVSALPRLMFRPRRTFEQLRPHTGPAQGAIVALILIAVAGVTDALVRWLFATVGSGEVHSIGLLGRLPTAMGVVLGFLVYLLIAGLTYKCIIGWGKAKRPDMGLTIGLMGYAMFPVVVLGIAISVIMAYYGGVVASFVEETGGLAEDWSGWGEYWLVYWLVLLVMVLWGMRIQAKAAVVANESAGGRTLGCVLVAWIVSLFVWILLVELWFLATEGELVGVPWLGI